MTRDFEIVHVGGPLDGVVQRFECDNAPTVEWYMGKNGRWAPGVYRQTAETPPREGIVTFTWEPTA